ncbi:hypothetical protein Golax_008583, partial [Gossypium laxum]|nr:hypothetical protein [Gossypium laxum]
IFSLSSLSTSVVRPDANISVSKVKIPLPVSSSKLVGNFGNYESIGNRSFCLEALSTPEAIKKPSSPQLLKSLNCCVEAYKYASLSFEMVSPELVEDPQTANYDVTVIDPKITNCEKELLHANVQAPRLLAGNRYMHYYIVMGCQITSILQLEKPNEY